MKRILYTVIVLLVFTNIMVAQLGVGTEAPNTSSQLEVVSADRGILIPRIELESTTDQSTIRNGNVNSLMVFNTQTVNDVSPGYYYWYVDKWYKLARSEEHTSELQSRGHLVCRLLLEKKKKR